MHGEFSSRGGIEDPTEGAASLLPAEDRGEVSDPGADTSGGGASTWNSALRLLFSAGMK
jgi:hypothetical protein